MTTYYGSEMDPRWDAPADYLVPCETITTMINFHPGYYPVKCTICGAINHAFSPDDAFCTICGHSSRHDQIPLDQQNLHGTLLTPLNAQPCIGCHEWGECLCEAPDQYLYLPEVGMLVLPESRWPHYLGGIYQAGTMDHGVMPTTEFDPDTGLGTTYQGYTVIGHDRGDPIILCPGCHTEPCCCDTRITEDY